MEQRRLLVRCLPAPLSTIAGPLATMAVASGISASVGSALPSFCVLLRLCPGGSAEAGQMAGAKASGADSGTADAGGVMVGASVPPGAAPGTVNGSGVG